VPNVTMVVQMELVKAKTEREGFSWIDNQKKALDQFRHRSGRTARALQKGINIVLCTPDEENKAMEYMRILDIPETNRRVLRIDASGQLPEDINTFLGDAQV
jgi:superfamily II DNA/RNA helicase